MSQVLLHFSSIATNRWSQTVFTLSELVEEERRASASVSLAGEQANASAARQSLSENFDESSVSDPPSFDGKVQSAAITENCWKKDVREPTSAIVADIDSIWDRRNRNVGWFLIAIS